MLLTLNPPRVYGRPTTFQDQEFIQQVSVNALGEMIAIASQLQLHFWSNKKEIVYLASLSVPQCSFNDDPILQVLWHPRYASQLAVITARRVLFYNVDIKIDTGEPLEPPSNANLKETVRDPLLCDVPLCALILEELHPGSGFTTLAKTAGFYTFTVCTTLGVVHLIGWDTHSVLKTWGIQSLQEACRPMTCKNDETLPCSDGAFNFSASVQKVPSLSGAANEYTEAGAQHIKPITQPGMAVVVRSQTNKKGSLGEVSCDAAGELNGAYSASQDNVDLGVDTALPTIQEVSSDAILCVSFAAPLLTFAFALSNDSVFLARVSSEVDLVNPDITLHGRCHELRSVKVVCINATHSFLAVAAHSGEVSCHTIEASNLTLSTTAMWRFTCSGSLTFPYDDIGNHDISDMQWSSGKEELLCVGFDHLGVVVLHYSGICVMQSLIESNTILGNAVNPFSSRLEEPYNVKGFKALHWSHHGARLFVVGSQSKNLSLYDFTRVLSCVEVGPSVGWCTPLFLLMDDALGIVHFSNADGPKGVKQSVKPPSHYLEVSYPLRYGAMSAKGNWLVCAGLHGCATYSRASQCWFVFEASNEQEQVSCLGDPVWLDDELLAMPVRNSVGAVRAYEVAVYHPMWLSTKNALACIQMPCEPLLLSATNSCSGHVFLCVFDAQQSLRVYCGELSADARHIGSVVGVDFRFIHMTTLTGSLANLLLIQPFFSEVMDDNGSKANLHDMPIILLQPRKGSTLVCLRLSKKDPTEAVSGGPQTGVTEVHEFPLSNSQSSEQALQRVFHFWVDRFSPLRGLRVVTFESEGLFYLHLGDLPTSSGFARLRITPKGSNLIPLALSPYDGYLLCLAEACEEQHSVQSLIWRCPSLNLPWVSFRPVVYTHCVLALILQSNIALQAKEGLLQKEALDGIRDGAAEHPVNCFWTDVLFPWLETMRQNGSFTANMEYFLFTILERNLKEELPGLNRITAIEASIFLLRFYPEFYEIIAVCFRKVDTGAWDTIIGVLGPLLDFFQECVAKQCFKEALILVRVLLLSASREPAYLSSVTPINSPCTSTHDAVIKCDTVPSDSTGNAAFDNKQEQGGDLQKAFECAIELFGCVLREESFSSARELVQFMFLLKDEVGLSSSASDNDLRMEMHIVAGSPSLRFRRTNGAEATGVQSHNSLGDECGLISPSRFPSSSAPFEVNEEEQEQRKIVVMFHRCPQLLHEVEAAAVDLLHHGYLLSLHRLFQTFSLSLEHFIEVKLSGLEGEADKLRLEGQTSSVSSTVTVDLACVFDGLHIEFSLPRSRRPLGATLLGNFMRPSSGRNALPQNQSRSFWTQAQVVLYGDVERLDTVRALQAIFSGYQNLDLVFSLLLMSKADLLVSLATSVEDPQAFNFQVTMLIKMVSCPIYCGYRSFVRDVILSLPPNMRKVLRALPFSV
ncbi:unnamed protein product [Phytomonas sp. EM1]|nr:unnamed protein product [Phytomonas sp. EM1]|eukprot:CCW62746.1 unnamed protein product [Phytomonas sp. isolate EM1]